MGKSRIVGPTIGAGGGGGSVTDHGALTGLGDDDHTQYTVLAGRGASQTIRGGVNSAGQLILRSTAHATAGEVRVDHATALELASGAVGMELRLWEPNGGGSSYTGFVSPALAASVVYTLPIADGAADEVLKTDGSKNLAWVAQSGGVSAASVLARVWLNG